MNKEEKEAITHDFEAYLYSIGGLINGHRINGEPILSRDYFSIGPGWLPLVKNLIKVLVATGWNREVLQIKEKFGGLRFYVTCTTEEQARIILAAERESQVTCENCGKPGLVRTGGWMKTLCENCYGRK